MSENPNPNELPHYKKGRAFGEQTEPDQLTDGDEGDIPAPLTTVGPNGESMVLTPSPQAGPTNRYYKSKLVWAAKYSDDSIISQYDDDGNPRSVDDLPRKDLRIFILLDTDGKPKFLQELKPGHQLVYRRRTALRTGNDVVEVIHIVGWQKKVGDEFIRHISFVYESDLHIEMGDFKRDLNEGYGRPEQWRYPIKFTEKDEQVIT